MAIRKMVKDKRAIVYMHEDNVRKLDKCSRVSAVLHGFLAEVASRVNMLLVSTDISNCLYA